MQVKSFTHVQSVAASTWTITHNFGSKPLSEVRIPVNGVLTKIQPSALVHTSDNVLTVRFTAPYTGEVRLVGVTTDILRSSTDTYFESDN